MTNQEESKYKEVNGTFYKVETTTEMVELLEEIRSSGTRCRFHWGNTETGEDWGDEFDVIGKIGRSTGGIKIPLLIYNERSSGGKTLLDDCIVKIVTTKGKKILYQHPNYHAKATTEQLKLPFID